MIILAGLRVFPLVLQLEKGVRVVCLRCTASVLVEGLEWTHIFGLAVTKKHLDSLSLRRVEWNRNGRSVV